MSLSGELIDRARLQATATADVAVPACDVSVAIVNWNTAGMLRDCLASVYAETSSVRFEVIVVDNASTDESAAIVGREFPQVRLIQNPENRGFASANNQAIAVARGRYVLLLNSDTVILRGAIQKTVAYADSHPDAAVVGCRALNSDGTLQPTCFMFPSLTNFALHATYLYRLFPRSTFFGREQMSWWDRADERVVDVVTGCYMLVRRTAIDQIGVMDERFFMYAEETDWCYRFRRGGWTLRFTPTAEFIHIGGGSAPKLSARRAQITNGSFVKYMFKHWSRTRALCGVGLLAVFYLSRLSVAVPRLVLGLRSANQPAVENHWAGLKDILQFRRHVSSERA